MSTGKALFKRTDVMIVPQVWEELIDLLGKGINHREGLEWSKSGESTPLPSGVVVPRIEVLGGLDCVGRVVKKDLGPIDGVPSEVESWMFAVNDRQGVIPRRVLVQRKVGKLVELFHQGSGIKAQVLDKAGNDKDFRVVFKGVDDLLIEFPLDGIFNANHPKKTSQTGTYTILPHLS